MTMIRYELVVVLGEKIALKFGGHFVCLFYIFCMLVMLYERIELCLQKLLIKKSFLHTYHLLLLRNADNKKHQVLIQKRIKK